MKTISAVVKNLFGEKVYVYAIGDTEPSGKFAGGIHVCRVGSDKKMQYAQSHADLININYQVTQALREFREGFLGIRWNNEATGSKIRDLTEMQSVFARIFQSDGCFLQALDTALCPILSPIRRSLPPASWIANDLPPSYEEAVGKGL